MADELNFTTSKETDAGLDSRSSEVQDEGSPFLSPPGREADDVSSIHDRRSLESRGRQHRLRLHLCLILGYSVGSVVVVLAFVLTRSLPSSSSLCSCSHSTHQHTDHTALWDVAPPRSVIREYGLMSQSKFVGRPVPSSDATEPHNQSTASAAWDDLLSIAPLRVSQSELLASESQLQSSRPSVDNGVDVRGDDGDNRDNLPSDRSRSSVALPHGGVLAWLGVLHELHCVRMLYEVNYRDVLHPQALPGSAALRELQVHADHCIDQLREAVMCRADLESLTTFTRREGYDRPLLSPERPLHRCVDWNAFVEQVKDSGRVVPVDEMRMLVEEHDRK